MPIDEAPQMRALGLAGAGSQGDYSKTSYSLIGTGRFTPTQGANPTIGEIGQESVVQEAKIEVIFPETKQEQVLAAMLQAHPYEEPAYDVYTIENQSKIWFRSGWSIRQACEILLFCTASQGSFPIGWLAGHCKR